MLDTALIPEKTVITAKGDGASVDISAAVSRVLLLNLAITRIIEQESLDISIFGSPDGTNFAAKLTAFPQKFYRGEHPMLLDLTQQPAIKFLRAHWDVGRWGRGADTPMFEISLTVKEVPAQVLQETANALGQ